MRFRGGGIGHLDMRGSERDYDLLEENITGNDREGNSEELEESNSDVESISNKQFEPESDPTGSSSKPESDSESDSELPEPEGDELGDDEAADPEEYDGETAVLRGVEMEDLGKFDEDEDEDEDSESGTDPESSDSESGSSSGESTE